MITSILPTSSLIVAAQERNNKISIIPATDVITINGSSESSPIKTIFSNNQYRFTVERDYNQIVDIEVVNPFQEPIEFTLEAEGVSEDLAIDFVGKGSSQEAFVLLPNEKLEVQLGIHTQDATKKNYQFNVNAINQSGANIGVASVDLFVDYQDINLELTEIEENPYTLAKTIKITNNGDRVSDLSVAVSEEIKNIITFEPMIDKFVLPKGQSVTLKVIPDLQYLQQDIHGSLYAIAAGQQSALSIGFNIPKNKELYEYTIKDLLKKEQTNLSKLQITDKKVTNTEDSFIYESTISNNEGFEHNQKLELINMPANTPLKELEFTYQKTGDGEFEYKVEGVIRAAEWNALTNKEEPFSSQIFFDDDDLVLFRASGVINKPIGYAVFADATASDILDLHYLEQSYKNNQINDWQYYGYTTFKAIKIAVNIIGLADVEPTTGFMLFGASESLNQVDNKLKDALGINNNHLDNLLATFRMSLFGQQCINRRVLVNNFYLPTGLSTYNGKSTNGYVTSRIYSPNSSNYYREDFSFTINDQEVFKPDNTIIEGSFAFDFSTELLQPGQNNITQKNTHNNQGNYIVETDKVVYIPLTEDQKKYIYKDKDEKIEEIDDLLDENIVISKPDFAVYPEMIQLNESPIIAGNNYVLNVQVANRGSLGSNTSVVIKDNGKTIYSDDLIIPSFTNKLVEINWKPTEGEHEIEVIVNEEYAQYEFEASNNSTKKKITVLPEDKDAPEVFNISPGKKAGQLNIVSFDYKDATGVKEATLLVNGNIVPENYFSIQKGRGWFKFPNSFSNGKYDFVLTVKDFSGNETTVEWSTVVELSNSLVFTGEQLKLYENETVSIRNLFEKDKDGNLKEILNGATFTVENTSIAQVEGQRIKGISPGTTMLKVKYNGLETTIPVVVQQVKQVIYNLTISDINTFKSTSMDLCGVEAPRNYCEYIQYSYKVNGGKFIIELNQEKIKQFNKIYGSIVIDNKVIYFELGDDKNIVISSKDADAKISLQYGDAFDRADISLLDLNGFERRSSIYQPTSEIYLPSGKYNISASVLFDGKSYAVNKEEWNLTKGNNILSFKPENYAILKFKASGIQFYNAHLNNTSTWKSISARLNNNEALVEKGNYSLQLFGQDNQYEYGISNNLSVNKDTTLNVGNTFKANLQFAKDEYKGGESVSFYSDNVLNFKDENNNVLTQLYNLQKNYDSVKAQLVFTNVNNKQDVHRVPIDYFNYVNITLPNVNGTYEVTLTIPELEQVQVQVKPDKKWTIHLSGLVNKESLNSNTIYVVDSTGEKVDVKLEVVQQTSRSSIIVSPKSPYKIGQSYTLVVTPNVKSDKNKPLNRQYTKDFTIQ